MSRQQIAPDQQTPSAKEQLNLKDIGHLFARLSQQEVEQFHQGYQLWTYQQQIADLTSRVALLQQEIAVNAEHMQQFQPSPIALATLAQLQASGVDDVALLDTMLARGDAWLDHTMELLTRCEELDMIRGDYTEWCQHALEGAYEWITTMDEAATEQPAQATTDIEIPTASKEDAEITALVDTPLLEDVTEELLLQKLMSDTGKLPIPTLATDNLPAAIVTPETEEVSTATEIPETSAETSAAIQTEAADTTSVDPEAETADENSAQTPAIELTTNPETADLPISDNSELQQPAVTAADASQALTTDEEALSVALTPDESLLLASIIESITDTPDFSSIAADADKSDNDETAVSPVASGADLTATAESPLDASGPSITESDEPITSEETDTLETELSSSTNEATEPVIDNAELSPAKDTLQPVTHEQLAPATTPAVPLTSEEALSTTDVFAPLTDEPASSTTEAIEAAASANTDETSEPAEIISSIDTIEPTVDEDSAPEIIIEPADSVASEPMDAIEPADSAASEPTDVVELTSNKISSPAETAASTASSDIDEPSSPIDGEQTDTTTTSPVQERETSIIEEDQSPATEHDTPLIDGQPSVSTNIETIEPFDDAETSPAAVIPSASSEPASADETMVPSVLETTPATEEEPLAHAETPISMMAEAFIVETPQPAQQTTDTIPSTEKTASQATNPTSTPTIETTDTQPWTAESETNTQADLSTSPPPIAANPPTRAQSVMAEAFIVETPQYPQPAQPITYANASPAQSALPPIDAEHTSSSNSIAESTTDTTVTTDTADADQTVPRLHIQPQDDPATTVAEDAVTNATNNDNSTTDNTLPPQNSSTMLSPDEIAEIARTPTQPLISDQPQPVQEDEAADDEELHTDQSEVTEVDPDLIVPQDQLTPVPEITEPSIDDTPAPETTEPYTNDIPIPETTEPYTNDTPASMVTPKNLHQPEDLQEPMLQTDTLTGSEPDALPAQIEKDAETNHKDQGFIQRSLSKIWHR